MIATSDLRSHHCSKNAGTLSFSGWQRNVTDEASLRAAMSAAEKHSGPLRGEIACAGILHAERILGREGLCDLDAFRRVIEVNLVGTFNLMRLAADFMQNNPPDADGERGVIVMTASAAAFEGQIGQTAYAASKGGIAAMTLPAARECGERRHPRGVSIAPGVFETPMMQTTPNQHRQAIEAQIPFPHRFGRPDEFAGAGQREAPRQPHAQTALPFASTAGCEWRRGQKCGRGVPALAGIFHLIAA